MRQGIPLAGPSEQATYKRPQPDLINQVRSINFFRFDPAGRDILHISQIFTKQIHDVHIEILHESVEQRLLCTMMSAKDLVGHHRLHRFEKSSWLEDESSLALRTMQ